MYVREKLEDLLGGRSTGRLALLVRHALVMLGESLADTVLQRRGFFVLPLFAALSLVSRPGLEPGT
jgi:hypothetical protein